MNSVRKAFAAVTLITSFALTTSLYAQASHQPDLPTPAQLHDQLNQEIINYAAKAFGLSANIYDYFDAINSSADDQGRFNVWLYTGGFTSDQLDYLRANLQEAGWQFTPGVHLMRNGWLVRPTADWSKSPRGNEPADIHADSPHSIPSVEAVLSAQAITIDARVKNALLSGNFGCGTDRYTTIEVEAYFPEAVTRAVGPLAQKGWTTRMISLNKDSDGSTGLSLCIAPAK